MKQLTLLLFALFVTYVNSSNAQPVMIPKEVRFLVDSATKRELVESLNQFLAQKEGPNRANQYVLPADLPAMSALLDEFKGIDKNTKTKDDHFYKPFVENIVDVGNNNFLIQLNYMGYAEGLAIVRASFRLMAKKDSGKFYFYSVLKRNTASWKAKKIGFINYHFKDTLYKTEAKSFLGFVDLYNQKLNVKAEPVEFYQCDDFSEAAQLIGIDYKAEYAGMLYNDFTSHENQTSLEINGRYTSSSLFDRHDLWHDRLRMVLSAGKINRPVDEGCAYLYGGSWGKTWPEVRALFTKYAAGHPDADWLKLYTGYNNFYLEGNKTFVVAYVINALIVQKIEKEKGFAPVLELLGCGKRETAEENYFTALEKVSGVSKTDFNKTIWELIKNEPN